MVPLLVMIADRRSHFGSRLSLGESVVSTKKTRRDPACLLVVSLLACAGCGDAPSEGGGPSGSKGAGGSSPSGSSGPRLVFITNGNSDWWNAVEKGMTDGGDKFGAGSR